MENGVMESNSFRNRPGGINKPYLQFGNSSRNNDGESSFKNSRSKMRYNSFNKNALKRRLSKEKESRLSNKNSGISTPMIKKEEKYISLEIDKINDEIKNDLNNYERPVISQVRHTIGNDNRKSDSLSIATKISVSKKLSPKFKYLRDSGLERGGTQSFKGNLPGSLLKNVSNSTNLKLLTPKSSAKTLTDNNTHLIRNVPNLTELNIIKWEGTEWPDIESELSFGKCLGQGSFAKVFQGIDKKLKKHVAIKVVDKAKLDDEKRQKLAQKEISILSSIDHKNLCKFYRMLEDHKRVIK